VLSAMTFVSLPAISAFSLEVILASVQRCELGAGRRTRLLRQQAPQ